MDETIILQMVKDSLGIKSTARDTRLLAIVRGVIQELTDEKGVVLDASNACHLLFVTDLVSWRFEHTADEGMPRHLQFRLHNLIIHNGESQVIS